MTKTDYCANNAAFGYYPLDPYGYNIIYINGFDSDGTADCVYFTFSRYSALSEKTTRSYHKSKIYANSRGEFYFWFYSAKNIRIRVYFNECLRITK